MQCSSCQHDNPDGDRFCGGCGAALERVCSACSHANPATHRFCGGCGQALGGEAPTPGLPASPPASPAHRSVADSRAAVAPRSYTPKHLAEKILRTKSAIEGERKRVTVLFADVKGSMELAEELDPERWHDILNRFFAILTEGVHRFEGTVNQYTGDGVMALFGAPIAHEDHAQRACYAALGLRDEISRYATEVKRDYGVGFSTRMGLHSGEVVVGRIGDDLRMDYTAQGQTVGLAQRMEALASPDTCYLTGTTAALVQGYFELEDLGDFAVKGARERVPVHRLVGVGAAHTRFDISRARGLTRFVGRDDDMETLASALAQAHSGNGQVVGIVADAGTGKSRLCFEFVERCRARGIIVNEGHALAHATHVPYLAVLEAFRHYYGIDASDEDRVVREKIAGRMLLIDESFREVLPVIFEFFGVPDPDRPVPPLDADTKQRQLFSVLRRMVQGADPQTAGNLVTLIEDLHWLDPGSAAFLEQWVDAIAGSSSLLVLNFRPEYHADWMQKSYYRQLPLAPLGPDAVRDLLEDLLGRDPSTEGLAAAIHERTGGNPFFTEEVVQSLIESGQLSGSRGAYRLEGSIENLEVPPSVQGVLAARIDRLAEREKQVLQAAAVIGREFSEPILEAAAELPTALLREAVAALKSSEFIYEQALYPVAEYAFKHALTEEVALRSQLTERRQRTHASVARAIERIHAGKLEGQAALLAHHWAEAGENLVAAQWSLRAAEHVGRSDPAQCVQHMQRVLALTDELADSPERAELRLEACRSLLVVGGWRTGLGTEEIDRIYSIGRAMSEQTGTTDQKIGLVLGYGTTRGFAGDIRTYYEKALECASLVDATSSVGARGIVLVGRSYSAFLLGRLDDAVSLAERNSQLTEGDIHAGIETAGFSAHAQSLQARAEYGAECGRIEEAWALVEQGIRLGRQHDLRDPLIWTLGVAARVAELSGDRSEQMMAYALEAREVAEKSGSAFQLTFALRNLALAQLFEERPDDAVSALEECLDLARRSGVGLEREAQYLMMLAQTHRCAGDMSVALSFAEQAIARAQEQGARFFEMRGELEHARALGAAARIDAARRALARAETGISETGARASEPVIAEERARLDRIDGKDPGPGLERARELYAKIGANGHAARLARELGT